MALADKLAEHPWFNDGVVVKTNRGALVCRTCSEDMARIIADEHNRLLNQTIQARVEAHRHVHS